MDYIASDHAGDMPVEPLKPGDLVCLKADQTKIGAIVQGEVGKSETVYKVLMDGRLQTLYASQIRRCENFTDMVPLSLEELNCRLSALQIKHPDSASLYSLNSARIDYMPWQFRPVLKFIHSDRPRLLIADGVGVGKTIEAGLIVRELAARMELKSILIICPKPLIVEGKWETEMKRFDEQFIPLDSRDLRYCINEMDMDGEWPERFRKIIVPFSLLTEEFLQGNGKKSGKKRQKGLLQLDPPPHFDLVIVDEAHHIRNDSTWAHRCARFFCENASAAIFLTATPIMLGNGDLYTLLNLLRPDLIVDKAAFDEMAEPNKYITNALRYMNAASDEWHGKVINELTRAANTPWGRMMLEHSPAYGAIMRELERKCGLPDERIRLIKEVESLHTFDGLISRTRRKDVDKFAIRKPETVSIVFTDEQREIYNELIRLQETILGMAHSDHNVRFMMCTLLRQAASCIFGLAPHIGDILSRGLERLEDSDEDELLQIPMEPIRDAIRELQTRAANLKGADPKLEALKKIVTDKQKLPSNKLMLFSSFRHTLAYLEKNLCQCRVRIGMVHGGVKDEERLLLRKRFEYPRENPDALDMLLFSEVGGEGLDYQFCDTMVNYDLPWNPMRIEQRIGRLDRKGQKSEVVQIFNLITQDTIDADIYYRCLERIGVFNTSIGESDEILGELATEIRDIGEAFNLSPEERRKKLERLADNAIRRKQEEERLEKSHSELFGIALPEDRFSHEIQDASNFWLAPEMLENMLRCYLKRLEEGGNDPILGSGAGKTLRLKQSSREILLADFRKLPRRLTPAWRQWENWLKGSNPWLEITFDSQYAQESQKVALLNAFHPFIIQAANTLSPEGKSLICIRSKTKDVSPGNYEFALYLWRYLGSRERTRLVPIAADESIERNFFTLLKNAENSSSSGHFSSFDILEDCHHGKWEMERKKYMDETRNQAVFRKSSLEASHRARIATLSTLLDTTIEPKLLLMRKSQLANAEADFLRRTEEIERSVSRADILAECVTYGIIEVRHE